MVSEKTQAVKDAAALAVQDTAELEKLVGMLSGSSRRSRQDAASILAQVSKTNPEMLASHVSAFIDALNRPEAQTRWECLDILTALVPIDSRSCDKAIPGAEVALFDEDSGLVRLAALRFLAKLGSSTENRSLKTWPLLDEAIQCYHGDFEYQDMLVALIAYSEGKLAPEVKTGLADRVRFDAENAKGALKRRSQQIVQNLS